MMLYQHWCAIKQKNYYIKRKRPALHSSNPMDPNRNQKSCPSRTPKQGHASPHLFVAPDFALASRALSGMQTKNKYLRRPSPSLPQVVTMIPSSRDIGCKFPQLGKLPNGETSSLKEPLGTSQRRAYWVHYRNKRNKKNWEARLYQISGENGE